MKTTFKSWSRRVIAGLLIALPLAARAQDEEKPKVGFIRLVNAVGAGTGNVHLEIDGEDQFPKGYKLGQRTGGIGLKAGAKKVKITREGVTEGSTSIPIGVGETMNIVSFAEKMPAEGDKPEHWEMRILKLKQRDVESGYRLTVLSVCKEPETLFSTMREGEEKKTPNSAKRLMTTSIDLGSAPRDLYVYARNNDVPLAVFRPEAKGNYVVVLYDDPDGSVKAVSFFDPKFVIAG
ncbi:hypothetical protein [Luteolibacter soli]|uniref:Uncharacterized protein n=1 Tax=Luteolibacter soli TaxID=3135280 RepID=A0ABU9AVT1_9BACT